MSLDKILLIPYLSKELNLIGHKTLPFKFKTYKSKKWKGYVSGSDSETDKEPVKVIFDSRKMICELVTACIELLKQIKSFGHVETNDEIDKLRFVNNKLERQIDSLKKEVDKKLDELAKGKEESRQLREKISGLEKKLKESTAEKSKVLLKCETSKNILKHNLKKQEDNVRELHDIIWKQFNMVDKNYFPDNFEIVKIDQPDFNKLWRDIKYSRPATKEDAFKKVICILQENNHLLMEDNRLLKNLLLVTLNEINEFIIYMSHKLHLENKNMSSLAYRVNELFDNVDELKINDYKTILESLLNFFKNALEAFDEASFLVSDNLFVCWSDVISKSQSIISESAL